MLSELFGLTGKVALITGAGSGLGRVITTTLAKAGADVVGLDRNATGLAETGEIIVAMGRRWSEFVVDVTDVPAVRATIATIDNIHGGIDILVNNAGVSDSPARRMHEMELETWDRVIAVNLTAVFTCSREVLPLMLRAGRGKIVNIASMWGLVAPSGLLPLAAYGASKGGLVNLTRELAIQYARDNIQVNAICPGFFLTNMGNGAYERSEFAQAAADFVPMKRLADAGEIRGAVLFLASEAASYVTGACLSVDGGCLAR